MALLVPADKMQVDEPHSDLSSSPISSAPGSPHNQNGFFGDTIHVASRPSSSVPELQRGGVTTSGSATSTQPHSTNATHQSTTTAAGLQKPKRQRKKKEVGPDGKPIDDGKPKVSRPRKPREPKEKSTTNGMTAGASRKKVKVEEQHSTETAPFRQPTLTEMVGSYTPSPAPTAATPAPVISPPLAINPIARPYSSGQKYDPIRGSTMDSPYSRPPPPPPPPLSSSLAPQVNRASATPSIASLIDPPAARSSASASTFTVPPAQSASHKQTSQSTPLRQSSNNLTTQSAQSPSPTLNKTLPVSDSDSTMDVDQRSPSSKLITTKAADLKAPSKASSAAPTPKVVPGRSSPPASKGTGSGLLSSSDLFGGPSAGDGAERKGVNIDIQIKLDPNGGNHVNVAQEIIKKYGRDAINPRAAAHREQLLQVMAAANKIDGGSGEDMSIDLTSDLGDDSNVEMGGMDDDRSAAADGDKPRKRRKKTEEYDLDDEFIDDTELAWQQQAAVAKDGFFVYAGPLVPEVDATRVEATGAGTRGGRARGRGRGKAAGSSATHASLAEKKETGTASPAAAASKAGRGRTRVTPAVPKRSRPTKADKERLEAEKATRERAAADSSASSAPVPPALAAPPAQTTLSHSGVNAVT